MFAESGIRQKGGDGSAQRGRSVIYDCLVCIAVHFLEVQFNIYNSLILTLTSKLHILALVVPFAALT